MPFHHGTRKRNRAPEFDYRLPGPYFVTICVEDRRCLFGSVMDATLRRNAAGTMVADVWTSLEQIVPAVTLDAFVVMPNHVHAIVQLNHDDTCEGPTLSFVIQTFKRLTTNRYAHGVTEQDWPRFADRLWQRSFHDHIVRNERDLDRLRAYIAANPARWSEDRYHPAG